MSRTAVGALTDTVTKSHKNFWRGLSQNPQIAWIANDDVLIAAFEKVELSILDDLLQSFDAAKGCNVAFRPSDNASFHYGFRFENSFHPCLRDGRCKVTGWFETHIHELVLD